MSNDNNNGVAGLAGLYVIMSASAGAGIGSISPIFGLFVVLIMIIIGSIWLWDKHESTKPVEQRRAEKEEKTRRIEVQIHEEKEKTEQVRQYKKQGLNEHGRTWYEEILYCLGGFIILNLVIVLIGFILKSLG